MGVASIHRFVSPLSLSRHIWAGLTGDEASVRPRSHSKKSSMERGMTGWRRLTHHQYSHHTRFTARCLKLEDSFINTEVIFDSEPFRCQAGCRRGAESIWWLSGVLSLFLSLVLSPVLYALPLFLNLFLKLSFNLSFQPSSSLSSVKPSISLSSSLKPSQALSSPLKPSQALLSFLKLSQALLSSLKISQALLGSLKALFRLS